MEIKVAGITFAVKADPRIAFFRPSGPVELKHEPFIHPSKEPLNDPLAIRVYNNSFAIGYVPAAGEERKALWEYHSKQGSFPKASVKDYSYSTNGKDFNDQHSGTLSSILLNVELDGNFGTYKLDGDEYERASNVLEAFDATGSRSPEGHLTKWMIDSFKTFSEYKSYMSDKANKGTEAHDAIRKACELGVIGNDIAYVEGLVSKMDEDVYAKIPKGFWSFIKEHCKGYVSVGSEQVVFDHTNFIAGTYDMLMRRHLDNNTVLIDWKSAKSVSDEHLIKTCFYAKKAGADEAWVVAFGSDNKCGYQLKKLDSSGINAGYAIMVNINSARRLVSEMKEGLIK
jgi:hypothetical protein